MLTTVEQMFCNVFKPMIPFYMASEKQKSRGFIMFSIQSFFFLYHICKTEEQSCYNVFSFIIPFCIRRKQQWYYNEQQKSNDFTMFSGQRSLSIPITPTKEQWFYNFFKSVIPLYTYNNNRRVMILQCFQVNDPFLYPMQTAQERRFHNFFKPMIPFYIPWDNKWSEVLQLIPLWLCIQLPQSMSKCLRPNAYYRGQTRKQLLLTMIDRIDWVLLSK